MDIQQDTKQMEKVLQDQEAQIEENDTQLEGGITEDADKCCLFVPIKLGVQIVGILIVVSAGLGVLNLLGALSVGALVYTILLGASLAPAVLSAFYFLKFLINDNSDTRAQLPTACALIILQQLVQVGAFVVYVLIYNGTFGALIS